jgi:hypothetical protein
MVAPCETFGRWHRWHVVEVVTDGRDTRAGHALRVMECERCGTRSWRWGPVPAGSGPPRMPVETPSTVTSTRARAVPHPAPG